jgi:uncharacterized protein with HEPN domain
MSDRPVALLIEDIWEATGKISRFTKGMTVEQFARDQKTTDAVVRIGDNRVKSLLLNLQVHVGVM